MNFKSGTYGRSGAALVAVLAALCLSLNCCVMESCERGLSRAPSARLVSVADTPRPAPCHKPANKNDGSDDSCPSCNGGHEFVALHSSSPILLPADVAANQDRVIAPAGVGLNDGLPVGVRSVAGALKNSGSTAGLRLHLLHRVFVI